jgi:hypothetical protein
VRQSCYRVADQTRMRRNESSASWRHFDNHHTGACDRPQLVRLMRDRRTPAPSRSLRWWAAWSVPGRVGLKVVAASIPHLEPFFEGSASTASCRRRWSGRARSADGRSTGRAACLTTTPCPCGGRLGRPSRSKWRVTTHPIASVRRCPDSQVEPIQSISQRLLRERGRRTQPTKNLTEGDGIAAHHAPPDHAVRSIPSRVKPSAKSNLSKGWVSF